jgi:hypothetical protein
MCKSFFLLPYSSKAFCVPDRMSIRSLCSTITGDANLFAMFRLDAVPIECPFRAPLTFTYNRGHGECRYPISSVDSCIQSSRLLFSYQACPDVTGTESTGMRINRLAGSLELLLNAFEIRRLNLLSRGRIAMSCSMEGRILPISRRTHQVPSSRFLRRKIPMFRLRKSEEGLRSPRRIWKWEFHTKFTINF